VAPAAETIVSGDELGRSLDRAALLRLAGVAAAGAALPGSFADDARAASASGFLRPHPRWRFVFVNHALTNPFFVPALYGTQDACSVFGTTYSWTGSRRSDVGEMVQSIRLAIRERVDGIAVSIIDPHAFNKPVAEALAKGIPIISYNADGGRGNGRLAYVGQDLYQSGLKFGARISELVHGGDIFLFIATPGQLNIQPRIDGALDAVKDAGKPIRAHVVATGVDLRKERATIDATYRKHKGLRGLFAVDGGSTQGVADVMRKYGLRKRGVRAGGYDLLPRTLGAIADGHMNFTIDQQPYLQGFLPTLQLFLFKYSGGLVAPSDTNTGLLFVTRANVRRYITTSTRYEGSSALEQYPVRRRAVP
jgi:simple sugar transport system substrate-binding protein